MNKPCKRCREHDEHYYWDHMDDEEKHFFKVMVGDFRHRMKIPKEFANNFMGHISKVVGLEAPNGKKCNVRVTRELNRLVLESGWEAFCSAHDIRQGDFLVFRYIGNSSFKVLIFNTNGCQKVSSCIARSCNPIAQEGSDSSVEILGASYDPSVAALGRSGRSQRYKQRVKVKTEKISSGPSSQGSEAPPPEGIRDAAYSADHRTSNQHHYVLSRNCKLTREQKAEVGVLEQKIQPEIPLYVTTLTKNISYLIIRAEYAVKYFPREAEICTLCGPDGRKCSDVNFRIGKDGKHSLASGWRGFLSNTGLKEGDVCILEVSKKNNRVTIRVHLLHGKSKHSLSRRENI